MTVCAILFTFKARESLMASALERKGINVFIFLNLHNTLYYV